MSRLGEAPRFLTRLHIRCEPYDNFLIFFGLDERLFSVKVVHLQVVLTCKNRQHPNRRHCGSGGEYLELLYIFYLTISFRYWFSLRIHFYSRLVRLPVEHSFGSNCLTVSEYFAHYEDI